MSDEVRKQMLDDLISHFKAEQVKALKKKYAPKKPEVEAAPKKEGEAETEEDVNEETLGKMLGEE